MANEKIDFSEWILMILDITNQLTGPLKKNTKNNYS